MSMLFSHMSNNLTFVVFCAFVKIFVLAGISANIHNFPQTVLKRTPFFLISAILCINNLILISKYAESCFKDVCV